MIYAMQLLLFVGVLFGLIVWSCNQAGVTLKTAIDVFASIIMVVVFCTLFLIIMACGPKSSTHTVQGEATVRVVIGVDLAVCEQFPEGSERLECIRALIDLAKIANETDEQEEGFGGIAGI